jgi:hypothetical protein
MIGVKADPVWYSATGCKHFNHLTGECRINTISEHMFRCSMQLSYCLKWADGGQCLEYRKLKDEKEYRNTRKIFVSYNALNYLNEELLFEHNEFIEENI